MEFIRKRAIYIGLLLVLLSTLCGVIHSQISPEQVSPWPAAYFTTRITYTGDWNNTAGDFKLYGGRSTGDDLFLYSNSTDNYPLFGLYGNSLGLFWSNLTSGASPAFLFDLDDSSTNNGLQINCRGMTTGLCYWIYFKSASMTTGLPFALYDETAAAYVFTVGEDGDASGRDFSGRNATFTQSVDIDLDLNVDRNGQVDKDFNVDDDLTTGGGLPSGGALFTSVGEAEIWDLYLHESEPDKVHISYDGTYLNVSSGSLRLMDGAAGDGKIYTGDTSGDDGYWYANSADAYPYVTQTGLGGLFINANTNAGLSLYEQLTEFGQFERTESYLLSNATTEDVFLVKADGLTTGSVIVASASTVFATNNLFRGIANNATVYQVTNSGATIQTGAATATKFISTALAGTEPIIVNSGTLVTMLNADMLDSHHASYFATAGPYLRLDATNDPVTGALTVNNDITATGTVSAADADITGVATAANFVADNAGATSTFAGNVKIDGILTGGSPVEIHGGLEVADGITSINEIVFGGDYGSTGGILTGTGSIYVDGIIKNDGTASLYGGYGGGGASVDGSGISADGDITVDGQASIGGGYEAPGVTIEAEGDIYTDGTLFADTAIYTDGNATAAFFFGDGSGLTNLPAGGQYWQRNGTNLTPTAATDTAMLSSDGSATSPLTIAMTSITSAMPALAIQYEGKRDGSWAIGEGAGLYIGISSKDANNITLNALEQSDSAYIIGYTGGGAEIHGIWGPNGIMIQDTDAGGWIYPTQAFMGFTDDNSEGIVMNNVSAAGQNVLIEAWLSHDSALATDTPIMKFSANAGSGNESYFNIIPHIGGTGANKSAYTNFNSAHGGVSAGNTETFMQIDGRDETVKMLYPLDVTGAVGDSLFATDEVKIGQYQAVVGSSTSETWRTYATSVAVTTGTSTGTVTFPYPFDAAGISCVCSFFNSDTPTDIIGCGITEAVGTSTCKWVISSGTVNGTLYMQVVGRD